MFRRFLLHPAEILVLLAAFAVLLRIRGRFWAWISAAIGVGVFLVYAWVDISEKGGDTEVFWRGGAAFWRGDDPYRDTHFLYPPTSLVVYALFGLVDLRTMILLWTAFNVVGALLLVVLTQAVLRTLPDDPPGPAPPEVQAVLTAAVVLSFSCRYGTDLGQLSVFMTLVLLAALWAQGSGRPILAGFWLALATTKTGTLIPFLLLFLRKRDLWTWIALPAFCLLFCLLTNPPLAILERCRECLGNIARLAGPGGFNDYSFLNPSNTELVSLDHAFYCMGLRDRWMIAVAQAVTLAGLGLWLVYCIHGARRLPAGAAAAMVCCYSCIFLYHRFYDLLPLVVPLVYAVGRARGEQGLARWLYSACAAGVLAALYLRVGWLGRLAENLPDGLAGRLVGIIVLPYGVWLVLGVLFCLAAAERQRLLSQPTPPAVLP
jgi:hypothetical protein